MFGRKKDDGGYDAAHRATAHNLIVSFADLVHPYTQSPDGMPPGIPDDMREFVDTLSDGLDPYIRAPRNT